MWPGCFSCLKPEQGDPQEVTTAALIWNYLTQLSEAPEEHSIYVSLRQKTAVNLLNRADWGSTALQWQTHCSADGHCCFCSFLRNVPPQLPWALICKWAIFPSIRLTVFQWILLSMLPECQHFTLASSMKPWREPSPSHPSSYSTSRIALLALHHPTLSRVKTPSITLPLWMNNINWNLLAKVQRRFMEIKGLHCVHLCCQS